LEKLEVIIVSQQTQTTTKKNARRKLVKHRRSQGGVGPIEPDEKGIVPGKNGGAKPTASSNSG
jgi:hypothetical protein